MAVRFMSRSTAPIVTVETAAGERSPGPPESVRGAFATGQFPPRLARSPISGALPPLLVGVALLALWQLATQLSLVPAFLLPAPADVWDSFRESVADGLLPRYAGTTLVESLLGCALGVVVALPLGYAIARSRLIARALQPYIAASQALPAVAIAPLIALWLGYGLSPVVALCALIVFFPMAITTTLGLRLLDRDVLDAARVDGASGWRMLWHIELPLALPSVLAGLRTSLTLSVTGAVVGEFVVGANGLGQLLLIDRSDFDSAGVFATLFALALLAAVLYGIARLAERLFSYVEAA
jgi:putative riboflavin transport system permease protein